MAAGWTASAGCCATRARPSGSELRYAPVPRGLTRIAVSGYMRPHMTWADGILLIVMVLSAILAFLRGFLREVLGVAAWIGAAIAAFTFREPVVAMFGGAIEPDWVADGVAVGVVFLV